MSAATSNCFVLLETCISYANEYDPELIRLKGNSS